MEMRGVEEWDIGETMGEKLSEMRGRAKKNGGEEVGKMVKGE